MAFVNKNYQNLKQTYLFSEMAKRQTQFAQENPDKTVIRMGIGDVTLPLPSVSVTAMKKAADELSQSATFRGYGPEQGYDFLREAVQGYYADNKVQLDLQSIFISDGAKSDCGNITDIFSDENVILVPDPVYPVYVDTNIMRGRKILYMNGNEENGFLPMPPIEKVDIIYLCSPNNPTGAAYSKKQLTEWVSYALENDAVILYDAAYEAFIEKGKPKSIYEIPNAKKCAIEMCSLSKTAGFTGTRCGYTIVPVELEVEGMSLNQMWNRRQTTKFNGVPYIVQRGAEAVFTEEGLKQAKANIAYYKENAKIIADTLSAKGIKYYGGEFSPYIWLKCPDGKKSWEFFDFLLNEAAVVGTPGAGFGENGEGYFRLTGFGTRKATTEAMERLKKIL